MAAHLDAILDSIEDGVFIVDRHGHALAVNAAYEQHTGMARAELLGKNVEELNKQGLCNIAPITPEIVATGRPASSIQVTRDNRSMPGSSFWQWSPSPQSASDCEGLKTG